MRHHATSAMAKIASDLVGVQKSATPGDSGNRIAVMAERAYRQLPTASRQRGLPSIGFELRTPNGVDVTPIDRGPTVVRCCETHEGRTLGELEVSVFSAALIIDRDGILEQKATGVASDAASRDTRVVPAVPVSLPGASGYHAEVEAIGPARPALPYTHVFAMASNDLGVDGGVLVTVRCARHDWPAAEAILRSLVIFSRNRSANDVVQAIGTGPALPIIGRNDDD
jgi:hypothetical protein